MKNEPVAWMAVNELNGSYITFTNDQKQRLLPHVSQCYGKWIPLYTHPVDETIKEIAKGHEGVYDGAVDYKGFARAILRKAEEK